MSAVLAHTQPAAGRDGENRPEDSNAYETPRWLWEQLHREFGFEIDAFADDDNHKCGLYFTQERSAFANPWSFRAFGHSDVQRGPVVWCNPPYGQTYLGRCVRRMAQQSREHGATVVALVPPSTDTTWWHEIVMPLASEIRLFNGRIRFEYRGQSIIVWDEKRGKLVEGSNRGSSCLIVFRPGLHGPIWRSMSAEAPKC